MLKRNDTAPFDLLSWLEGRSHAIGVVEDRKGRVRRRFTVDLTGTAQGDALRLHERFVFADGERQERTWVLTRGSDGTFSGRAEDSASDARGCFAEGAAYMSSELKLKIGNRIIAMRFDDAFYPSGPGLVLNRSTMSKWGVRLGQILIQFRKDGQRSP
ncbi:MAG: DUF3833 family protein [Aestuariivirga sp.]|uniref:DUF3833 family protein n=1 Tax=Aestuariivirga sp. TaxID=2650926 RepID=UPI0025C25DAD|nr:DUF3833 family protein [Aestuariivirga sp.]MCA3561436.1 DUF3833 family protein [Aestuariivirga sp.]